MDSGIKLSSSGCAEVSPHGRWPAMKFQKAGEPNARRKSHHLAKLASCKGWEGSLVTSSPDFGHQEVWLTRVL